MKLSATWTESKPWCWIYRFLSALFGMPYNRWSQNDIHDVMEWGKCETGEQTYSRTPSLATLQRTDMAPTRLPMSPSALRLLACAALVACWRPPALAATPACFQVSIITVLMLHIDLPRALTWSINHIFISHLISCYDRYLLSSDEDIGHFHNASDSACPKSPEIWHLPCYLCHSIVCHFIWASWCKNGGSCWRRHEPLAGTAALLPFSARLFSSAKPLCCWSNITRNDTKSMIIIFASTSKLYIGAHKCCTREIIPHNKWLLHKYLDSKYVPLSTTNHIGLTNRSSSKFDWWWCIIRFINSNGSPLWRTWLLAVAG